MRLLGEENGCDVGVCGDDDGKLKGIVFQDDAVKKAYAAFPEKVCVDATYKLNELKIPLYIMLVEDGLGLS